MLKSAGEYMPTFTQGVIPVIDNEFSELILKMKCSLRTRELQYAFQISGKV